MHLAQPLVVRPDVPELLRALGTEVIQSADEVPDRRDVSALEVMQHVHPRDVRTLRPRRDLAEVDRVVRTLRAQVHPVEELPLQAHPRGQVLQVVHLRARRTPEMFPRRLVGVPDVRLSRARRLQGLRRVPRPLLEKRDLLPIDALGVRQHRAQLPVALQHHAHPRGELFRRYLAHQHLVHAPLEQRHLGRGLRRFQHHHQRKKRSAHVAAQPLHDFGALHVAQFERRHDEVGTLVAQAFERLLERLVAQDFRPDSLQRRGNLVSTRGRLHGQKHGLDR